MDSLSTSQEAPPLAEASKRLLRRLLTIGENRVRLLLLEAQEERDRMLRALGLVMMATVFGLLTGMAVTLVVAAAFWNHHPVIALAIVAAVYLAIAVLSYAGFVRLIRNWRILSATIDQLKKDSECLRNQFV